MSNVDPLILLNILMGFQLNFAVVDQELIFQVKVLSTLPEYHGMIN